MGPNCRLQDGEAQMVLICATEFSKIFNGSSSPLILITEGPIKDVRGQLFFGTSKIPNFFIFAKDNL